MSDHTSNSVSFSVNPRDKRPLPEIIASNYGFPLAYHDVDGVRYYAVQDWLRGVVQPADLAKYWDAMKRRLKKGSNDLSLWLRSLPYRATDGKIYQRDFACTEVIYRLTERMEVDGNIRDSVVSCLIQAAIILDNVRLDKVSYTNATQDWPHIFENSSINKRRGWVYLLNAHNGQYKIGRARDLKVRMGNYTTLPYEFTLEHSIPCDNAPQAEADLHHRFASKRVKGEWFMLSLSDVEEVKRIKNL